MFVFVCMCEINRREREEKRKCDVNRRDETTRGIEKLKSITRIKRQECEEKIETFELKRKIMKRE